MATIKVRTKADGTLRYTAVIRLFRDGVIIHQEAKTFSRRTSAEAWAKRREVELEDPVAMARAGQPASRLGDWIQWYIDEFESFSKWQRTKSASLRQLMHTPLADADIFKITPQILVDHVRQRRSTTAGPATAGNDLTWLGVVLRAVKGVKGLPVPVAAVDEARESCRRLKLIGKSKQRNRRPTPDEIERLRTYFSGRDARAQIPMLDIFDFAISSTRREAEICRLEWADNHDEEETGLVRDAKHPRHKEGNHKRFKYTTEAWKVVQRQPRTNGSPYIFPYDPKSVGAAFTRACAFLGIRDLRFHDLRHEAVSRLFEAGYEVHEVPLFSLHESWQELKRYTNLQPGKVRKV
jgi:integrase